MARTGCGYPVYGVNGPTRGLAPYPIGMDVGYGDDDPGFGNVNDLRLYAYDWPGHGSRRQRQSSLRMFQPRQQRCRPSKASVVLLPNCGARTNAHGSGVLGFNDRYPDYLDYAFEISNLNPNDAILPGRDAAHFHLDSARGQVLQYIPVERNGDIWTSRYHWKPTRQQRGYLEQGRVWVNFHSVEYPEGIVSAHIPPL